jgi:hypothetical protein
MENSEAYFPKISSIILFCFSICFSNIFYCIEILIKVKQNFYFYYQKYKLQFKCFVFKFVCEAICSTQKKAGQLEIFYISSFIFDYEKYYLPLLPLHN